MQNGVAKARLTDCVSHPERSGCESRPSTPTGRKRTSKDLKTEHVYFSDSNYFVWKTVNTITLTTELGGFEGLAQCFPSRPQRLLRITAASGLQDSGGSLCFYFLVSEMNLGSSRALIEFLKISFVYFLRFK